MLKIRQYKNRKYYCADLKTHLNMKEIAALVEPWCVTSDRTGGDITDIVKGRIALKAIEDRNEQMVLPFTQHYRGE